MKTYMLENERILIDFLKPNPLVSIPAGMWYDGLKDFTGTWVSCCYTKTTTKKDRILFTIYRSDMIAAPETDDGDEIHNEDGYTYVILPPDIKVVLGENDSGGGSSDDDDPDKPIKAELKKAKLCLYYGTKDTTSGGWDKFNCNIIKPSCLLGDLGYSYREINLQDSRCWYEFHLYDEMVKVNGHRPIPMYSSENLIDSL